MDSDLKSRIEKLKQRRYPYQNSEGKWGFTDVFGKVVEPAHLNKVENNPYEQVKGALELDTIPPLSHRALVNIYTDYVLPIEGELSEEELDKLEEITEKTWPRKNEDLDLVKDFGKYSFIREDMGRIDIRKSHIIKYGIEGKEPIFITECNYDNVYPYKEGRAKIFRSHVVEMYPYHWMTKLGIDYLWDDAIISKRLDHTALTFSYEEIMEEGVYGFINKQGEEIIPCQYEEARDFSEGLAAVSNGWWGYIDKDNKVIIPFEFEWADDFIDGFARVLHTGNFFIIDKEGFCYESYEEIEYGLGNKFYLEDTELL